MSSVAGAHKRNSYYASMDNSLTEVDYSKTVPHGDAKRNSSKRLKPPHFLSDTINLQHNERVMNL